MCCFTWTLPSLAHECPKESDHRRLELKTGRAQARHGCLQPLDRTHEAQFNDFSILLRRPAFKARAYAGSCFRQVLWASVSGTTNSDPTLPVRQVVLWSPSAAQVLGGICLVRGKTGRSRCHAARTSGVTGQCCLTERGAIEALQVRNCHLAHHTDCAEICSRLTVFAPTQRSLLQQERDSHVLRHRERVRARRKGTRAGRGARKRRSLRAAAAHACVQKR